MIRLFLILLLLPIFGCSYQEKVKTIHEQRVEWVHERCPAWMDAQRIVAAVNYSVFKRGGDDVLVDVVLASLHPESGFNPLRTDKKGSYGIYMIQRQTAKIILKRKISKEELQFDIELNIDLGVRHQRDVKSVQAYNAGVNGMKSGAGNPHAFKVIKRLKSMPWIKKPLDEKYMEWFDFKYSKLSKKAIKRRLKK